MSKAILISIKPKWCELIASGKKTVEVRKSRPKIATPFKVYVYATWNGSSREILVKDGGTLFVADYRTPADRASGKVIGEFVCNKIDEFIAIPNPPISVVQLWQDACLTKTEVYKYFDNSFNGYGWHISNLMIYDEPKDLSEFRSYNVRAIWGENGYPMPTHNITRPPQSWCYVEELKGE